MKGRWALFAGGLLVAAMTFGISGHGLYEDALVRATELNIRPLTTRCGCAFCVLGEHTFFDREEPRNPGGTGSPVRR